jgi:hypothetical protein
MPPSPDLDATPRAGRTATIVVLLLVVAALAVLVFLGLRFQPLADPTGGCGGG